MRRVEMQEQERGTPSIGHGNGNRDCQGVPDKDFIAFLKDWTRWPMPYAADESDVVAA